MAVRSIYYEMPYQLVMVNELREPLKRFLHELQKEDAGKIDHLLLLREGIILWRALDKVPEPSVENTRQPESHILIGIRDYFFGCQRLPYLANAFRKAVNLVIIIIDTDFYRSFFNVWVRELRASPWPEMGPMQPDPHFWVEGTPPFGRTWEEIHPADSPHDEAVTEARSLLRL